jgi:hypothetical protein
MANVELTHPDTKRKLVVNSAVASYYEEHGWQQTVKVKEEAGNGSDSGEGESAPAKTRTRRSNPKS